MSKGEKTAALDASKSEASSKRSSSRKLTSSKSGDLSAMVAPDPSNPAGLENNDKTKPRRREKSRERRTNPAKSGDLSAMIAPDPKSPPDENGKTKTKDKEKTRSKIRPSKSSDLSGMIPEPSNPADTEINDRTKTKVREKSREIKIGASKSGDPSKMVAELSEPADTEDGKSKRGRRSSKLSPKTPTRKRSNSSGRASGNNKSMLSKKHSDEMFESLVKHGRGRKRGEKGEQTRSRSLSIDVRLRATGRRGVAHNKSSDDLTNFLNEKSIRDRAKGFSDSAKSGNVDSNSLRSSGNFDGNLSESDMSLSTSLSVQGLQIGSNKEEEQENQQPSLNALVYKLKDTALEEELVGLFKRIEESQGFPAQRRAALGTNHITDIMCQTLRNDPDCTDVVIDDPFRFQELESSLPMEFAEGLRANVHVISLTMQGLSLDDEFLAAIGSSIQRNFTLKKLILAGNAFTSAGLLDFCWSLGVNESLWTVDLTNQKNGAYLLEEHEKDASLALANNKIIRTLRLDIATKKFNSVVKTLEERNAKANKSIDYDKQLIQHFRAEATRAENIYQLNLLEEKLKHGITKEWTMLCNLATIATINKTEKLGGLNQGIETTSSGTKVKNTFPAEGDMSSDGSFLDAKLIGKFFEPDRSSLGLIFNFRGQTTLFKKFGPSHKARETIATKFVEILLQHKKANEITQIVMADSFCGDCFVVALCKKCLGNPKILPKLFFLDLSNNYISDVGLDALSECIADKQTWRYLQVVRLHNQYSPKTGKITCFGPDSEYNLTKALCQNISVLCLSVKMECLRERSKMSQVLARNMDLLEQARNMNSQRRESAGSNDILKAPRNDMQQQIDKIAASDPAVWSLDASGDQRFLSLKGKDVRKLAKGLANNRFVTEVHLDRLDLDDEFAVLLGESLATNSAIRVLSLEGNAFSPKGVKAILEGISKNETLVEVRLGDQSQKMTIIEEVELIPALGENSTIRKLTLDINAEIVQQELHKRLAENQQSFTKPQRRSLPLSSENEIEPSDIVHRNTVH